MPPSPSPQRLLELIAAMAGQPVLMLADLVADRFVTGAPKRISREAPVLILRFEHEELLPGGGANAVANVAALGGRPLPLGVVGDDASGAELLTALAALGVTTEGIRRRPGFRTPTKVRILAGHRHAIKQQVVRYDVEGPLSLGDDDRAFLRQRLADWAGQAPVAVLSDYGYGAVEPELVADCRAAVGPEGTVLCDSRYRLAHFRGLDGATPNEEEAETLLGAPLGEDAAGLRHAGERLLERVGSRFLLVTRGSLGMSLFRRGGAVHVPVHGTDQVADVTGAGDTVIGTFALALAAGGDPLEAALLANYAGGIVVMKRGTATLTRDELRDAVASDPHPLEELRWERS
ncbi:MAG TPA: PfkB family carbohydrate kinase [Thermoanaerobaculia bacterium]|nr:PfkB family carbohydrate kinase [Thermoanaerobaculia bacterium]